VNQWDNLGPTDIDNGMLLCRYRCHRGMHEGHWSIVGKPNGRLEFSDREGNHIAMSEPRPRAEPILTEHGRRRAHIERLIRTRLVMLKHAA
jgi:hypothetical protein